MRQTTLMSSTLREVPADAEVASHQLLLRAGYIRQIAAGIYTYMPLGWRVLRKLEQIIREEMERAGAQELLMPALQPVELWKSSGRYQAYGPELVKLTDRHDREFALGPTHEEVITSIVDQEINSYKRLPVTAYQIQTKFRDERRPRSGLLRGREFLMKDAYSFSASWESLDEIYVRMFQAYERIFERCGLTFRAVEADAGTIGGEGGTHEFMALADIGEDTIAVCSHCDYAANLEKATSRTRASGEQQARNEVPALQKVHTPGTRTIGEVADFMKTASREIIKTLIYVSDGEPVAVLVRGDHEVNEIKLKHTLGAEALTLADAATTEQSTGAPTGYAGPVGLSIPFLIDNAVLRMQEAIAGANEEDYHIRHVVPGRDFALDRSADIRNVMPDDGCPACDEGSLHFLKGIEIGHVFKLGTKYSDAMNATYLDEQGRAQPYIMGCYGIGVSRLLSALVEEHHDERGITLPRKVAPFAVHLIPISMKDDAQREVAESLYQRFQAEGVEVLLDDRDERAGVKFNDADLIGVPARIVIGKHAGEGQVELVKRQSGEKELVTVEEAFNRALVEAEVSS